MNFDSASTRPKHGGDILVFCEQNGCDADDCIDLSTGIAPWCWPVPKIPPELWQSLPSSTELESKLLNTAAGYYQCDTAELLPVAGSQAAIEIIPALAKRKVSIAIPKPGYEEHGYIWRRAGAKTVLYRDRAELEQLVSDKKIDSAVVINPNNPTGEMHSTDQLAHIREVLNARGGFLIVDEAFIDPTPALSMMRFLDAEGLIVLRSIGKFFGLAGLRLGFIGASANTVAHLRASTPLWSVSTPALWLGANMLADNHWIQTQRQRCEEQSSLLASLMREKFSQLSWTQSPLFVTGKGELTSIQACQKRLAKYGVHTRFVPLDDSRALLRVGLANAHGIKVLDKITNHETY